MTILFDRCVRLQEGYQGQGLVLDVLRRSPGFLEGNLMFGKWWTRFGPIGHDMLSETLRQQPIFFCVFSLIFDDEGGGYF